MRDEVTRRNFPVWHSFVCPHKKIWWKTSSILPWPPTVVFVNGVVEADTASFLCRPVERLLFLH